VADDELGVIDDCALAFGAVRFALNAADLPFFPGEVVIHAPLRLGLRERRHIVDTG
jgi:hypothetical protein